MTIQQGERIVVGTPARQRWRLAVIGIVMTGLSAALAVTRPYGDLGLVVGVLGLVFFGPLTLSLLLRAARRTPALILDGDGFTDHATLAAAGFVRWEDVHSVSEQPFAGRIFVTVTVAGRDVPKGTRIRPRRSWRCCRNASGLGRPDHDRPRPFCVRSASVPIAGARRIAPACFPAQAEGVGFEPTVTLPPQWFSRPSPSATRRALLCVTAYGNADRDVSRRGQASPSPTIAASAR